MNYDPEKRSKTFSKKLSRGERNAVIIFCLIIFMFLLPDIFRNILPEAAAFISGLTINAPAVAGIAAMYIIRDENNERLLDFSKVTNEIPWG